MQSNLKDARRRKGWSLEQLAAKSGVHKSTISRLERRETLPMLDTALALENALGLKVGSLDFSHERVSA